MVGRGLRRRSYAVNEEGRFEAEYANVYGVPFAFIPTERPTVEPKPPHPVTEVRSVAGREALRITFPKLDGYRFELPDDRLIYLDRRGCTLRDRPGHGADLDRCGARGGQ